MDWFITLLKRTDLPICELVLPSPVLVDEPVP